MSEHIDGQPAARRSSASTPCARRSQDGPSTAFDLLPAVYGEDFDRDMAGWLLTKVLCYLTHLEALGAVERLQGEPERWATL